MYSTCIGDSKVQKVQLTVQGQLLLHMTNSETLHEPTAPTHNTRSALAMHMSGSSRVLRTIVGLESLLPSLFVAKYQVNPLVKVCTDVITLQRLSAFPGEVSGIYVNRHTQTRSCSLPYIFTVDVQHAHIITYMFISHSY